MTIKGSRGDGGPPRDSKIKPRHNRSQQTACCPRDELRRALETKAWMAWQRMSLRRLWRRWRHAANIERLPSATICHARDMYHQRCLGRDGHSVGRLGCWRYPCALSLAIAGAAIVSAAAASEAIFNHTVTAVDPNQPSVLSSLFVLHPSHDVTTTTTKYIHDDHQIYPRLTRQHG